jgi:inner membrane protein
MDLLTHGLVGAALAQSGAPREEARVAAGVGFLAGMLADADALITSAADPLLVLEVHRHFTHSLLFIPVGALIAAAVLWPFMRRQLRFPRLYLYALLGYALAGLLDACTSYGTHLLWPFSEGRQALSIIAVVDPLMTLAIGIPLAIGVVRRRPNAARLGLALGIGYLALGFVQHERAESAALALARERGHEPRQAFVKPTIGNLVLWRSTYIERGRIYADAIRPGPLAVTRIFVGESAALFDPARDMPWAPPGSPARLQVDRFGKLSDGYLARHPHRPGLIGDARYAMLPTSVEPLWGIAFEAERPDARAEIVTDRTLTPEIRSRFLEMLLGR